MPLLMVVRRKGVTLVEADQASPQEAPSGEFVALLAKSQRPVFLCAMSILRNTADADEVVQESGLILWKKFHEFQPGTNFVGWACQIARYQALKLLDCRARIPQLFANDFLASFAVATDDKALARLERRQQAILECIKKLGTADRELILRRYRQGASTRDVAESMERSIQGTRRSLQRIREALAKCVRLRLAQEEDK
jgi:RNA polymerase sigma-70 factor (ECF subfamily)